MMEWIGDHEALMWWLVAGSAVAFVGSLILVPILVVRIPADYFAHATRHHTPWSEHHPVVRAILFGLKNILGTILLVGGVAMLVLPGQGLLTLAMGLMLIDFPGKYRFERWLVSRRPILRAINWLRRRSGHTPLTVDET